MYGTKSKPFFASIPILHSICENCNLVIFGGFHFYTMRRPTWTMAAYSQVAHKLLKGFDKLPLKLQRMPPTFVITVKTSLYLIICTDDKSNWAN